MKRIIKTYFKLFMFLIGISLLLVNCETEQPFNEDGERLTVVEPTSSLRLQHVTLEQLQQKQKLKATLEKISKTFNVNKPKRTDNTNSKIDSNDGSFTILTDEIIEVTTDSTETYAFRIETPIDSTSTFENFVLVKNNDDSYDYFIYRYARNEEQEEGEFQYDLFIQEVSDYQINLGEFDDYINNKESLLYLQGDDQCWYTFSYQGTGSHPLMPTEGWVLIDIDCYGNPSGGGSGSGGGTNTGNTGGSSGGDGSGEGTGNNTGGGGSTSPTAVLLSYQEQIGLCMGITVTDMDVAGKTFNVGSWMETASIDELIAIDDYLDENGCSEEAQSFTPLVMAAYNNGYDVDSDNKFFYFSTWDDYPCQKSIVEDANSGNFGEIGQAMQAFFTDNSLFGNPSNVYVNYDVENLGGTHLAETGINMTPVTGNLLEININFNQTFIEGSTDLGIFSVAIYENLHALLAIFLDLDIIDVNNPDTNLSSLANEYAERKALFLIDNNDEWDATDSGFLEHEIISELVAILKLEIKNYGESKGYVIDDFIYEALAWNGLAGTTNFLELPSDEQELIYDTVGYEIENFELLAQGTPCN